MSLDPLPGVGPPYAVLTAGPAMGKTNVMSARLTEAESLPVRILRRPARALDESLGFSVLAELLAALTRTCTTAGAVALRVDLIAMQEIFQVDYRAKRSNDRPVRRKWVVLAAVGSVAIGPDRKTCGARRSRSLVTQQ